MIALRLYFFGASALLAALLTPLMRRLAVRLGMLDHPGPRKIQTAPVPYLGGLAVFLSFALMVGLHLALLLSEPGREITSRLFGEILADQAPLARARIQPLLLLLLGGLLCAAVGTADDRLGARLSPLVKLAVQFLAAGLAVAGGAQTTAFGAQWINITLSIFWIVAITNAVNFIDNMDGLAAGIVITSALILWAVSFEQGQFFMEMILLVLAGAAAGFLPFNFQPASIYLGDTGSLFLGYTIGVLTTLESYVTRSTPTLAPVILPLIVLTVPVFDMVSVIVIRLREGRPIYIGDRSHLSHRLVALGMSTRRAVLSLYLINLGLGLAALLLLQVGVWGSVLVLAQWLLTLILISVLLLARRKEGGA